MPELPEVEAARRAAHKVAAGRRIVEAHVADDPIVFEGVAPARFRRALVGRRVKAVRLVSDGPKIRTDERPDWPPRFTKLHLRFAGGGELALADGRRLGRIRLRQDPPTEPPISALGFDAWRALPTPARFHAMLRERNAPIKAVLLDQAFAAGIGNWIADEVLYQAGIAPKRRANTLSAAEAGRLRTRIRSVIGGAVRAGSDSDRFPRWWLFHRRWGHRRGGPPATTVRGEHIRHETVGGRTTAWVPSAQR